MRPEETRGQKYPWGNQDGAQFPNGTLGCCSLEVRVTNQDWVLFEDPRVKTGNQRYSESWWPASPSAMGGREPRASPWTAPSPDRQPEGKGEGKTWPGVGQESQEGGSWQRPGCTEGVAAASGRAGQTSVDTEWPLCHRPIWQTGRDRRCLTILSAKGQSPGATHTYLVCRG